MDYLSSELPEIDPTTDESWGQSLARKVVFFADRHKAGDKCLLQDVPAMPEINRQAETDRGPYLIEDFMADTFVGDVPWTPLKWEAVTKIARAYSGFNRAYQYLSEELRKERESRCA